MINWLYGAQAKPSQIPQVRTKANKIPTETQPLHKPEPVSQQVMSADASSRSISTTYTTGEGDGLVFNPNQSNIFEMI